MSIERYNFHVEGKVPYSRIAVAPESLQNGACALIRRYVEKKRGGSILDVLLPEGMGCVVRSNGKIETSRANNFHYNSPYLDRTIDSAVAYAYIDPTTGYMICDEYPYLYFFDPESNYIAKPSQHSHTFLYPGDDPLCAQVYNDDHVIRWEFSFYNNVNAMMKKLSSSPSNKSFK